MEVVQDTALRYIPIDRVETAPKREAALAIFYWRYLTNLLKFWEFSNFPGNFLVLRSRTW